MLEVKPVVAGSNPVSLASYSLATGCGLAPTKRDGQVRLLSGEPNSLHYLWYYPK